MNTTTAPVPNNTTTLVQAPPSKNSTGPSTNAQKPKPSKNSTAPAPAPSNTKPSQPAKNTTDSKAPAKKPVD